MFERDILSSSRKKKDKIYFRLLHLVPSSPLPPHTSPRSTMNRRVESPWTRAPPNFIYVFLPRDGDALKAKRGRFSIPRDRVSCNESPRGVVENIDRDDERSARSRILDFHREGSEGEGNILKRKILHGAISGWKSGFWKEGWRRRRRFVRAVVNGRTVVPRAAKAPRGKNVFGMRALLSRKKKREKKKKKRRSLAKSRDKNRKRQQVVAWTVAPFRFTRVEGFVEFLEPTKLSGSSIVDDYREEETKEGGQWQNKLTAKVCPKSWTAPRCEVEDIDRRVFSSRPEPTP